MKIQKIIVSVVTCVTLFVFSCTGVFAKNNAYFSVNLPFANDITGVIGELSTSKLNETSFKFMQDYANGVGNYIVVYTPYNGLIYFCLIPPNIKASDIVYNSQYDGLVFNSWIKYVGFYLTTGIPFSESIQQLAPANNFVYFFDYQNLVDMGYPETSIPNIWKPLKDMKLTITYDKALVDEPEPPVSSEPEPPVSSEPDPPVSSEPEPPVSSEPEPPPINEEYLGISPSAVKNVFSYFSETIGTAVDGGWVIFFYLIGIVITIKLIRYFLGE